MFHQRVSEIRETIRNIYNNNTEKMGTFERNITQDLVDELGWIVISMEKWEKAMKIKLGDKIEKY